MCYLFFGKSLSCLWTRPCKIALYHEAFTAPRRCDHTFSSWRSACWDFEEEVHVLESCATFYRLCLGSTARGSETSGHPNGASPPPHVRQITPLCRIIAARKGLSSIVCRPRLLLYVPPRSKSALQAPYRLTTSSRAPTGTAPYPRSLFDMSEITHPTIKGPLGCGTVGSPVDLADTIDRWLVPRNIPHVARSSYDPQSQPGPPPREIEVPRRPHLRIQRPWRSPRAGQRHPMLRTR